MSNTRPSCQSSRSQDAELVPFWVRHDDPGDTSLTDVDSCSPELLKALNLRFLIVGAKVEVDSVLASLRLAAGHQSDSGRPQWVDQEVAARGTCPDVFEVESGTPELTHPPQVVAVNQNTIDVKTHFLLLRSPGWRADRVCPRRWNLPRTREAGLGVRGCPSAWSGRSSRHRARSDRGTCEHLNNRWRVQQERGANEPSNSELPEQAVRQSMRIPRTCDAFQLPDSRHLGTLGLLSPSGIRKLHWVRRSVMESHGRLSSGEQKEEGCS
jgi:hypothetical protein